MMEQAQRTAQMEIDWFGIDMDAFATTLAEAKAAYEERKKVARQMDLCEARECEHGPFKKDGTPDKRRYCEGSSGGYWKMNDGANRLYWKWGELWSFFQHIGLMEKEE